MSASFDFGIAKILDLSSSKAQELLKHIKALGVKTEEDLKYVAVEDLTKNNLLNPIQARRLKEHWQQG